MAKKTARITDLTRDEVESLCRGWIRAKQNGIGESVRGEFSGKLNGRTFDLDFEGHPRMTYVVESGERIHWAEADGERQSEYAQILELGTKPGLFLINHLRSETFPLENCTLILDFETHLATLVLARLGDSRRPRDVERIFYFGYLRDPGKALDVQLKHEFTVDLVGKLIDWDYGGGFVVKHMYISRDHMVYLLTESFEKEKGLVEAAECDYIKVRDNVYVVSWLEKGHQGMQGVVLMDLDSMHDVGSFFGISVLDTLDNYTFAANGRFTDVWHMTEI